MYPLIRFNLSFRSLSLLAALTLLSAPAHAFERYDLPSFDLTPLGQTLQPTPLRALYANEPIQDVRVQVFPHLGSFATPQGREKQTGSVILKPADPSAKCELRKTDLKGSPGELIGTPSQIEFTAVQLERLSESGENRFFQCKNGTTVVRESGLTSYSYLGSLWVKPGRSAEGNPIVEVINLLDFETYIKGVLPSEIPASWPMEVLKAQAIAARTYAEFSIRLNRANGKTVDLDDTVQYQAYVGLNKMASATNAAVEATRGIVITHQGAVIIAYFSSDAGGFTEGAQEVWPEARAPYCVPKKEMYPVGSHKTDWVLELTQSELSERLLAYGLIRNRAAIHSVRVLDRNSSGRVSRVEIGFVSGPSQESPGPAFRYATRLRSTLFSVEKSGDTYIFHGKGFGHGVGMAQEGARSHHLSLKWNAEKILKFYYEGTELRANLAQ